MHCIHTQHQFRDIFDTNDMDVGKLAWILSDLDWIDPKPALISYQFGSFC